MSKVACCNTAKQIFYPVTTYFFGGTWRTLQVIGTYPSAEMRDNQADNSTFVSFRVPSDFNSLTSAHWVGMDAVGTGNIYIRFAANYGANGQDYAVHAETGAWHTFNVAVAGRIYEMRDMTLIDGLLANLALGDYVGLRFERDGNDGADTLDNYFDVIGVVMYYDAINPHREDATS